MSATTVRVVRHRDPLEGQCLRLLGRLRRHGGLELLLVLADGSKRMVPATWTDLDADPDSGAGQDVAATLGRLEDLLAACALVSALITTAGTSGGQAARTSSCEEDGRAACAVEFDAPGSPSATRVAAGRTSRPGGEGGGEAAGPPDRRDHRPGRGR